MESETFFEQLPVQLNLQQREAVQSVDGPVLLLAVPGSGKTTVLVSRLGYMILCRGISSDKILTITYTVAAANDMSARFSSMFGEWIENKPEFRTINGICAKIIYYCAHLTGKRTFQLASDERQISALLSGIYQRIEDDYPTENDLKAVRIAITYIKNMMLGPEELEDFDETMEYQISAIYREYCAEMRRQGLMDYDDQMVYAYIMLKRIPGVLEHFRSLYPYICVDEAQDTSKIQHEIISLLADKNGNLFMVGDEDQSIYGFRAAYPEALLSFEKQHTKAKVLLMEQNFRSNAKIVSAADRFIQKNVFRHEKHMTASRESTADVRVIDVKGRRAQYRYLAKIAANCTEETAVLYRDNEMVIPLVDLLERSGAPYRIRNAELTFFTHRVVSDIEKIFRFALNPWDSETFSGIYYKLGIYQKKTEIVQISEEAGRQHRPIIDYMLESRALSGAAAHKLRELHSHFQNMLDEPADRAIDRVVSKMGYGDYIAHSAAGRNKIFLLKTIEANEASPAAFLERMSFLEDVMRNKENDRRCPFILSTIHASKGLEYETVYMIDVSDGLFPENVIRNVRNADRNAAEKYEEERRLFYVGVTRAKNRLNLFRIGTETAFVNEFAGNPEEQPETNRIQMGYAAAGIHNGAGLKKMNGMERIAFRENGKVRSRYKDIVQGPEISVQEFSERFREGAKITHIRIGKGIVIENDGSVIKIRFDNGDVRTFDVNILCSRRQVTC